MKNKGGTAKLNARRLQRRFKEECRIMIRPQTCPICGVELAAEAGSNSNLFPFCSVRCRQVDFFRWCEGKYAIVEPFSPHSADEDGAERQRPSDDA